ncbi:hypothetical protein [Bacteroides sp.]
MSFLFSLLILIFSQRCWIFFLLQRSHDVLPSFFG